MKTTNKILSIFLFLSFLFVNSLFSQTIYNSKGYQCDFEDANEYVKWKRNTGPLGNDCANKWYFGKPGANGGEAGLYVSCDSLTNNYNKSGVSVITYREFTFDAGSYEISFDWQAGGLDGEGFYVCWIPKSDVDSQIVRLNSTTNGILQKWVSKNYALDYGTDSIRLGQRTWNTISDTIYSDGTAHYLVFVWNNIGVGSYPPAVAVDNILIMEEGRCGKPTDLSVNIKGSDVLFSWKGEADAYDVRCCNNMTGGWIEFNDVTEKYQVINGLPEGVCTYYVRSKCAGIAGAWVSINRFLFYPGTRCVDYLNLTNQNCFFGTTASPSSSRGVVDFGYQDKLSRHTIHWNSMERDPRTDNKLKTVPDGEIASVRLGNWDVGAQAESVEYNYLVDTLTSAILILNYAVVLEDPAHDSLSQPRFTLQILYQNKPIDEFGCGEAAFSAGYDTDEKEGWHQFLDGKGWWKDWTTVSINLAKFHGKSLKIKLTTYDCTASGHYGYAYFTIGCSDGKIKGLTCAGDERTIFKGPDGFKYRWYLPSQPTKIISESQILDLPGNDTLTYYLDVIQPTNINCFYTLSASAIGRWPKASCGYTQEVKNCRNIVTFENKSFVRRINQITTETVDTDEKCENFLWDFGDGTTSNEANPKHTFPDEGGLFNVTLSAGIADDRCADDTTFTIFLPRVGAMRDTIHAVSCLGTPYMFNGVPRFNTGCYSDTVRTAFGCDSITTLDLFVAMPIDSVIYDTICSDETYYFDGKQITETGKYVYYGKTSHGCDSIVTLKIIVDQALYANFDSIVGVCVDDNNLVVDYEIISGGIYSYVAQISSDTVSYDATESLSPQNDRLVIPMPDNIKPGHYNLKLTFGEKSCGGGKNDETIPLEVYYSKDILVQRWGDVLAVVNKDYNGGYSFVSYQWFKNGVAIPGATSSILYVQEGLDLNADYSVLLTRADNGLSLMTCNADLFDYTQDQPNIVIFASNNIKNISAKKNARVKAWTTNGVLVKEFNVFEGDNILQLESGFYILEFIFEDNQHEIQQVIID